MFYDDPPIDWDCFGTEEERQLRLEEEEWDRQEREYKAKLAAQRDFNPAIYDRQLEKLRSSPSSAVMLPSPEETAWMTEEERNCVEWFDREDYDTFMKRSAWYPGGGWVVQYCRYICDTLHLASDEALETPANDLLIDRDYAGRYCLGSDENGDICKYEYMNRDERFLYVVDKIFQAAEEGNPRAQNTVGCLFEKFRWQKLQEHFDKHKCGCSSNSEAAREWYRRSAGGGCFQGLRNYARVLMDAIGATRGTLSSAEYSMRIAEDRKRAMELFLDLAGRGDGKTQYRLARMFAEGRLKARDVSKSAEWLRKAAQNGYRKALDTLSIAGDDASDERLFAELFILLQTEQLQNLRNEPDYTIAYTPIDDAQNKDNAAVDKLLENLPEGTVLPPSPGRGAARIPNLKSANPSFAARLIIHVRDRFGGDAPAVYRAAHVSRKTYSSIVGNELRPVSKQTVLAFALALKLSLRETDELLESAGFSLSQFYLEDIVIKACIIAGIYDIDRVNAILAAHNAKTFTSE